MGAPARRPEEIRLPPDPDPAPPGADLPRDRRRPEQERKNRATAGPQPAPGDPRRMTALLADPSDAVAVAELTATALLDAPAPAAGLPGGERSDLVDRAYSEYKHLRLAGVE